MGPLLSRLSSKSQITLPKKVRQAARLEPGDAIVYEVKGEIVTLRKASPFDATFHKALSKTLNEWATEEDDEAFRDL
jgi:antitoxin PrlF